MSSGSEIRAPRGEITTRVSDGTLLARLSDYFSNPWRPAVGAVAFGLYAFLCLASFELGRTDGLPGVVPEAGLPAHGSGLFEDDGGFL